MTNWTQKPKAFLFDLNGTMIDDMFFHTQAWHQLLTTKLGSNMTMDEVKMHMYGKNQEFFGRVFGPGRFTEDEIFTLSMEKENMYQTAFRPHLKLIAGLDVFLEKAYQQQIRMAVASAAIPYNIDFVLDGIGIRHYIGAVVSADDVKRSKPDPETFVKAAELLHTAPEDCLVFEDNPKGVESALKGGMKAVVLTTMHEEHEFVDLPNIVAFTKDYNDPFYQTLF